MFRLPEVITEWHPIGNDGLGGITWSQPIRHAARIAFSQQKFTDANGDSRMSTAVCYTNGEIKMDSVVLFGDSQAALPPANSNDVRAISNTPSGAGTFKKLWFS